MPKKSTMCADNPFWQARDEASSCNDRFGSRESAADEVCIDRTRLARIEAGTIIPHPEEVILMAEAYNAPQLTNYYCSRLCPLGKLTIPAAQMRSLDRLTIRILTALSEASSIRGEILEVARDGEITQDEHEKLRRIASMLESIEIVATETKMFINKHLKGEETNGQ